MVNWCDIYKMNGDLVQRNPGMICQFYDDGSFVTASMENVKYLSIKNEVKWTIPGEFHHQMNKSPDGERILALTTHYTTDKKGKRLGIDKFLVLKKDGTILHETLSDWIFKGLKGEKSYSQDELTHFNSFYEIPAMKVAGLPDYIKPGNYIVNSYNIGVFILSPDLKTILHHQKFATSRGHKVHDVQILPNGNYLFFNNIDARSTDENKFSSVQEMNHQGVVVNEFPANTGANFFSLHMGGVQALDDEHWFITHAVAGNYLYSNKTKKIIRNIYQTHFQNDRYLPAQQVKVQDLAKFLRNH